MPPSSTFVNALIVESRAGVVIATEMTPGPAIARY